MGKRVLVCGGAGYIGAHMCEQLAAHGHDIVVFDNLEGGRRENVRRGVLSVGDLRDSAAVEYSAIHCGVRCADTILVSCATPNCSSVSLA